MFLWFTLFALDKKLIYLPFFSYPKLNSYSLNSKLITGLPLKIGKNWLNMDVVESEKLGWLKNLPEPTNINKEVSFK